MATNVSVWLRAFRPPLQGVYPRPDEIDLELAELLRQADERMPGAAPLTGEDAREAQQARDRLAPAAPTSPSPASGESASKR